MTTLTDNQGRAWDCIWAVQSGRIAVLLARMPGDKRPMRRVVPDDSMARAILEQSAPKMADTAP